jgi:hypothetical protein
MWCTGTTDIFIEGINPFFIMDCGTRYDLKPGLWGVEFLNRSTSSKIAILQKNIILYSFHIKKKISYLHKIIIIKCKLGKMCDENCDIAWRDDYHIASKHESGYKISES